MRFSSSTCGGLTLESSWNYKGGQIIKWTISLLADSGCLYWEIKNSIFSFGYRDTYFLSSEAAGIKTALGRKIFLLQKEGIERKCMNLQRGYIPPNEGSNFLLTLKGWIFDKRQGSYDAKGLWHARF